MKKEKMLRINEVSQVTQISRNTLYRYMRNDTLPYTELDGVRFIKAKDLKLIKPNNKRNRNNDESVLKELKELKEEVKSLHVTVTKLTHLLTQKEGVTVTPKVTQIDTQKVTQKSYNGNYEQRKQAVRDKLFPILDAYKEKGQGYPSTKDLAIEADISRGTCRKYRSEWEELQEKGSI
ncbi:hypothetical protein A3712_24400 [Vibrio sp. HI00D65]|uniref:helix-turn-helix transcriptional regulator n=2 Tax=Vibrio sp. HI00D65 TaxID=1822216 RepID=UPI0007B8B5AD|nr:helix-turn-helix domain-containing protein [Vibrio sp. HI00D65]KZX61914.1 hypothetical protein A3712_24400 [Vibrio sp. HI00D65]